MPRVLRSKCFRAAVKGGGFFFHLTSNIILAARWYCPSRDSVCCRRVLLAFLNCHLFVSGSGDRPAAVYHSSTCLDFIILLAAAAERAIFPRVELTFSICRSSCGGDRTFRCATMDVLGEKKKKKPIFE